ncbi:MAG: sugar nucleotide-binding protein [Candidatus Paceibacterota bacterium]
MKDKILITGGSGKLATELKKHLHGDYLSKKDFDFTKPITRKKKYDLIVHIGAYTNVKKAEFEDQKKCFMVNVYGTFNLVEYYKNTPFIFISTEYAYNPIGVYALTKKLGEEIVKTHPRHLILRTLFKPNPFPFSKAYIDQYTQGDYIDVIAKLLAKKLQSWNKKTSNLEYLGTGRKTMFELAQRTRPDVRPNSVKDYIRETGVPTPTDYE